MKKGQIASKRQYEEFGIVKPSPAVSKKHILQCRAHVKFDTDMKGEGTWRYVYPQYNKLAQPLHIEFEGLHCFSGIVSSNGILLNMCAHIHKRYSRKQHFRYEEGNTCSGRPFVNVTKVSGVGYYWMEEPKNDPSLTFMFTGIIRQRADRSGIFEYDTITDVHQSPLLRRKPLNNKIAMLVQPRIDKNPNCVQYYVHCANCCAISNVVDSTFACNNCHQYLRIIPVIV